MARSRTQKRNSSSSSERSRRSIDEEIERIGRSFELSELTVVIELDGRVTFSDLPRELLEVIRRLEGDDEGTDPVDGKKDSPGSKEG